MSETRQEPGATAVELFTTCPPWSPDVADYRLRVAEVARWSEEAGAAGMVVGGERRLPDPWLVAQLVVAATLELSPVVALPGGSGRPATLARQVAGFVALNGRRVDLALAAAGPRAEVEAPESPPARAAAVGELARQLGLLLDGAAGPREAARRADDSVDRPLLPEGARPAVLVTGATAAAWIAARQRQEGVRRQPVAVRAALRVGILARSDEAEAWRVAHQRFPAEEHAPSPRRAGIRDLEARHREAPDSPYWLVPFETERASCPYLVGSYERVGEEIARYTALGYDGLVLDVPFDRAELAHARRALATRRELRMAS